MAVLLAVCGSGLGDARARSAARAASSRRTSRSCSRRRRAGRCVGSQHAAIARRAASLRLASSIALPTRRCLGLARLAAASAPTLVSAMRHLGHRAALHLQQHRSRRGGEVAGLALELAVRPAAAGRRDRDADLRQDLVGVRAASSTRRRKAFGLDDALAVRPGQHERRVQRQHQRRVVVGRVAVARCRRRSCRGSAPAGRRSGSRLRPAAAACRPAAASCSSSCSVVIAPMRISLPDCAMPRRSAILPRSIRCARLGEAQLHHRQQAVAAGQQLGVGAEAAEQLDRVGHRARRVVLRNQRESWNGISSRPGGAPIEAPTRARRIGPGPVIPQVCTARLAGGAAALRVRVPHGLRKDARGNLLGTDSAAARDAVDKRAVADDVVLRPAVGRPRPRDRRAIRHWPLPHADEGGLPAEPDRAVAAGRRARRLWSARNCCWRRAPARERAHWEPRSACSMAAGTTPARCGTSGCSTTRATPWRCSGRTCGTSTAATRSTCAHAPARALPEWDDADPLYPHVLALHAFGLEECNLQAQAEEAGRRALALDARSPWAIHAVAHVMEMQGRFDDGASWLRQHQGAWAEGNGYACHLVVAPGVVRARRRSTTPACCGWSMPTCAGDTLQVTLQRVDAASILWRLHSARGRRAPALRRSGGGVGPRRRQRRLLRVQRRARAAGDAGRRRWRARRTLGGALRRRALAADDAPRSNRAMAREVGAPLMRALLALARGSRSPLRRRCTRCAARRSASAAAMRSAT